MSDQFFCGQCGAANSADAVFCTNCGSSLRQETQTTAESPKLADPSTPVSLTPPLERERTKSSGKVLVVLSVAVVLLAGALLWIQFGTRTEPETTTDTSLATDTVPTTTTPPTTTSSSSTTTTTTTTLAPEPFGFASSEFWIDDTPMAQPPCDGSFITIIASTSGSRAASGSRDYSDGRYLRTDITCDSLNPYFSSGALQGQPIYLVFFGPYFSRYDAQQKCLDLGIRKKANCYVAPLTTDSSDRSVRYGPLDS